jgi:hypothetical protein
VKAKTSAARERAANADLAKSINGSFTIGRSFEAPAAPAMPPNARKGSFSDGLDESHQGDFAAAAAEGARRGHTPRVSTKKYLATNEAVVSIQLYFASKHYCLRSTRPLREMGLTYIT